MSSRKLLTCNSYTSVEITCKVMRTYTSLVHMLWTGNKCLMINKKSLTLLLSGSNDLPSDPQSYAVSHVIKLL